MAPADLTKQFAAQAIGNSADKISTRQGRARANRETAQHPSWPGIQAMQKALKEDQELVILVCKMTKTPPGAQPTKMGTVIAKST